MLMVEYLRLSPSYALAGEILDGRLSGSRKQCRIIDLYQRGSRTPLSEQAQDQVLKDFDSVIQTRRDFGDLVHVTFDDWWHNTGIEHFGLDHAPPRAHAVSMLAAGTELDRSVTQDIHNHFARRKAEHNPAALLVSIPLGVTKRMQMRMVSKLLEKYPQHMPIKSAKTSRPLAVQRLRRDPLEKGIHLLWLHARHPELRLWQLGVAARVSKTYSASIGSIKARALSSNEDDRNSLTILTHRMLTRAQLTAENAAHGIFPSHAKRPLPVFDSGAVYRRMIVYKPKLRRKIGGVN